MKKLHPVLQARAVAVKVAHAHLSKTVPTFRSQAPSQQFKAVQAHVNTMKGKC